ncbi:MAG: flagellar biosynthetic protein FliO [Bryobacterales bacterium]
MWSESVQAMQRGAAALLVLGLLFLLLWALRRKGVAQFSLKRPFGGGARRLNVVERLALTSQHSLFLVETTDQVLLLGSSPSGINLIETVGRKDASPGPPWPGSPVHREH